MKKSGIIVGVVGLILILGFSNSIGKLIGRQSAQIIKQGKNGILIEDILLETSKTITNNG